MTKELAQHDLKVYEGKISELNKKLSVHELE